MLTYTATATQHINLNGATVDRYQLCPQINGPGWEIADLRDGCVVGPVARNYHSGRSLIQEWLYS